MPRFTWLLVLLLIPMQAVATEDGKDSEAVATEGPLYAHLIVTNEGAELIQKWTRGSPELKISSVKQVSRGQFITVIVRFSGCAADREGLCNATVDYTTRRPDGTVYGEMRGAELWVKKFPPEEGFSQLAAEYMGLIIEPQDPAGDYTVTAKLRDRVADRTLLVSASFKVP